MTSQVKTLETLKGWESLGQLVQSAVKNATLTLSEALATETQTRLGIGEKLLEVKKILEPKRMWIAYLRTTFSMSQATAYRYIDSYQKVKKLVPKAVLQEAVKGNFKAVTRVEVVKTNPPPATTDPKKIVKYLHSLEEIREPDIPDVDQMLRECVNFVALRWTRVPGNGRQKTAFMRALLGMLLTKFGISSEQTFAPIAIPEVHRGRPKAA